WEIIRPEYACTIRFGGACDPPPGKLSSEAACWTSADTVIAVPYDMPVPGFTNGIVNTLRLWSARAIEEFMPDYSNHGDYVRACEDRAETGSLTTILFPEEGVMRTVESRLKQQYFFISASLQDILRRFKQDNKSFMEFDKKTSIQLNGGSCAMAIPELMRLLVDCEGVSWDSAWNIVKNTFNYTCHLVSKDGQEKWPLYIMAQIFPRHTQIIFEINQRNLDEARSKNGGITTENIRDLSIIEEGEVKRIKMDNLAIIGSAAVNGVSQEQTATICQTIFPEFLHQAPKKFSNKTLGISHRRWLLCANQPLANFISDAIGDGWQRNAEELSKLLDCLDNSDFLRGLMSLKQEAKQRLTDFIRTVTGVSIDPMAFFDVQSMKISTAKRQMLHVFFILHQYLEFKQGRAPSLKRVHIFSGKASPSDFLAKQVIHLINIVADLINSDASARDKMQVVFIPNFGITVAEKLVGATDLYEQLSTPLLDACGTSFLKYAINGAVAIASLSGAIPEIVERIGKENIALFGGNGTTLQAQAYHPAEAASKDESIDAIFNFIEGVLPSVNEGHAVYPLLSSLRDSDKAFVLLDFKDYIEKQAFIETSFKDQPKWARMCLNNIARVGWFSCDRLVGEYARDIWNVPTS
ncbi:MAG: glycogen/starch/alpha-glucan family phosphorylase, partial [Chitinivibrionales bacterium]|nr:glycogen/starch/alpha-glucan family phosphorylase [Chitinivibrionales bacterium]